jgi:hypothetical protein
LIIVLAVCGGELIKLSMILLLWSIAVAAVAAVDGPLIALLGDEDEGEDDGGTSVGGDDDDDMWWLPSSSAVSLKLRGCLKSASLTVLNLELADRNGAIKAEGFVDVGTNEEDE